MEKYSQLLGLSNEEIKRCGIYLYHGIRFDAINRLESIFQSGYISCGNNINSSFKSYDGSIKTLYNNPYDIENCNRGEYVSVMPYNNSVEFNTFIRENIFFALKGTIDALKTKFVSYDEYCELRKKGTNDELYSYASDEYMVKDGISLSDAVFIGIDSEHFNGEYNKMVSDVMNLINVYQIKLPFVDIRTNKEMKLI